MVVPLGGVQTGMKSPGEEILEGIPRAAGRTAGRPVAARAEEYSAMARECRQRGPLPLEARLSLFTERPMDSDVVYCCAEAGLPAQALVFC